jgi:hypothetical protein
MALEVLLLVAGVVLALGELIAWTKGFHWHSEEKRDPPQLPPASLARIRPVAKADKTIRGLL